MSKILLIESSSHNCSVGISDNGMLKSLKELSAEKYVHAESLHLFIASCLKEAGLNVNEIEAVAVSSGPGSYTGLRIGISAAKGICFAMKIPLIDLPTTLILANYARKSNRDVDLIIPMIDARRMEVYFAVYNGDLDLLNEDAAAIIESSFFEGWVNKSCAFVGDGAFKCAEFISSKDVVLSVLPSASMMPELANSYYDQTKFAELSTFEPFYLKDYLPGVAKKWL